MKTLKLTAVAVAFASMSGLAFAEADDFDAEAALKLSLITDVTTTDNTLTYTKHMLDSSTSVIGVGAAVVGVAAVLGSAGANATVQTAQKSIDNNSLIVGTSASGINVSGNGSLGNIGMNAAAGNGNQQANSLAIATTVIGAGIGIATADANYEQNSELNDSAVFSLTILPSTAAGVNGSLNGSAGNLGANSAAGVGNQQGNFAAISTINHGALAVATTGGMQLSDHNDTFQGFFLDNLAGVNGSVLGSAGNIGVNAAAGLGNQQVNTLAIASALP